ncbi:class I SAM-dependent methyltransferase [Romboutsia weinsteinii]|uniref:class I SAM-dependent methyltransferase n=1 Tax=Romboutsia weinsteinii TaxID=2020949 RepID=UPI001313E1BB|nr:class I SAM-dependent methyltransferase [Romboutsia weinsteinii]
MRYKEQVNSYYKDYDEENRLIKDNSHSIEFITTTHYLNKYIDKESKILELGAATGRYSFYYSKNGCSVTAVELCDKHIEIMREKTTNNEIEIIHGDALDLSEFSDDSFDVVLCLGPIYHLTKPEDRDRCIKESLRVLKPGGLFAIAYISRFATFANMINRNKENINDIGLRNIAKTGIEFGDDRDCFYHSTYDEIEYLMNINGIERVKHIGSDGISDILRLRVNEFTKEEFDLWMKYHLDTCENKSLIGYSQHGLFIGKK